jgi:hypothetical protein
VTGFFQIDLKIFVEKTSNSNQPTNDNTWKNRGGKEVFTGQGLLSTEFLRSKFNS